MIKLLINPFKVPLELKLVLHYWVLALQQTGNLIASKVNLVLITSSLAFQVHDIKSTLPLKLCDN